MEKCRLSIQGACRQGWTGPGPVRLIVFTHLAPSLKTLIKMRKKVDGLLIEKKKLSNLDILNETSSVVEDYS